VGKKSVLPEAGAGLLADFLSDPGATRVEVRPNVTRRLGSIPGAEISGTGIRPGPRGGIVVEARPRASAP